MNAKQFVLILVLTASAAISVFAMQAPATEEPMPAAEGVEIPRIVIVGKREHVADQQR